MSEEEGLREDLRAIVEAWSHNDGARSSLERLVADIHDYVLEAYGPPF